MNKFVAFPKIGQFRQMVKTVKTTAQYAGKDEEGNVIVDRTVVAPTLKLKGTVKIHGTNAGICFDPSTEAFYAQSRKNVITVEEDNAGFAFWAHSHELVLREVCKAVENPNNELVSVFGEWFGGNIQKGVAVNGLTKMFAVFAVKVGDTWVADWDTGVFNKEEINMYSVNTFGTYELEVDFNNPGLAVPELQKLTTEVENECPVGKYFGNIGVGEGIVWKDAEGNTFKVKGKKHSSTKVKELANVDIEKLNTITEFVTYAVTTNRLEQGIEVVFTQQGTEPEPKGLGAFLKWVMADIISEETDTLVGNGLEPKDIGKDVSNKARTWFFENY